MARSTVAIVGSHAAAEHRMAVDSARRGAGRGGRRAGTDVTNPSTHPRGGSSRPVEGRARRLNNCARRPAFSAGRFRPGAARRYDIAGHGAETTRRCAVAPWRHRPQDDRGAGPRRRSSRGGRLSGRRRHACEKPGVRPSWTYPSLPRARQPLQQETRMGRHPPVHRGDDVRAAGLQAHVVHSASRSGSVSPTISAASIARPLAPRMSVTTRVSFTLASSSDRQASRPAAGDRRTSGRGIAAACTRSGFAGAGTCQLTGTFPDRLPGTAGWVGRHQRRRTRVDPRRRQPTLGRLPEGEAPGPLAGVHRPDGNCPPRDIRPDRRRYRLRGG